MGKKYDAAAWAAKSSRLSTLSGSNSLASTTASVSPQGDEILIGEEELITKIDLNEKSVYTLIDMYQNPDSDFDKMDVLKRALAGKLLVA